MLRALGGAGRRAAPCVRVGKQEQRFITPQLIPGAACEGTGAKSQSFSPKTGSSCSPLGEPWLPSTAFQGRAPARRAAGERGRAFTSPLCIVLSSGKLSQLLAALIDISVPASLQLLGCLFQRKTLFPLNVKV